MTHTDCSSVYGLVLSGDLRTIRIARLTRVHHTKKKSIIIWETRIETQIKMNGVEATISPLDKKAEETSKVEVNRLLLPQNHCGIVTEL